MWIELALVSAILLGVRRIYEKELTSLFGNFSLSFVTLVFGLVPLLVLLFFFPIPENILELSWRFWWPLIVIWVVLYPIQNYLLYRSLREGELSEVAPVAALSPVLNIIPSYFLIGEAPSSAGFIGIAAVVAGTYLLLVQPKGGGWFSFNRPVLYMVLTTLCTAIGSTLDKVSIQESTPVFYGFVNVLGASVVFLILTFAFGQQADLKRVREKIWLLITLGVVLGLGFIAGMAAFQQGPTSYVLAVRAGGFFLPVFWGLFLLREKISTRKVVSLTLFAVGVILLAL